MDESSLASGGRRLRFSSLTSREFRPLRRPLRRSSKTGASLGIDQQALIDALRDVRFLHDIDNDHLLQIANITRLRDAEPGQVLFREGDVPQDVFLVVSGSVALDIGVAGGGSKRIMAVGP